MSFDFESRTGNIVQALKDYNSSTSSPDLSANLTVRVSDDNIIPVKSDKVRPAWRGDRFPAIFVRIPESTEEFATIGGLSGVAGCKKQMTVRFDVVGFVGLEGVHRTLEALDTEMRYLAQNIQAIFKEENDGSGTAMYVTPVYYNFDYEDIEGSMVGAVLVELEGKYLFS